jgi:hypothetical protein
LDVDDSTVTLSPREAIITIVDDDGEYTCG